MFLTDETVVRARTRNPAPSLAKRKRMAQKVHYETQPTAPHPKPL